MTTRYLGVASEMKGTADYVRRLAAHHGVTYRPGPVDVWADKITELCGDEVQPDEIHDLILALKRHALVTEAEATQLYIDYFKERSS
ncbi:hypothetical protein [Labrys sp. ZIDIC5]|uniref:hypothetical protein n=1 Tax=Labrys sedimenti TaxID=3106036 RepID=UPI002ACA8896|nr:hypothetical protein [Labrys sp. ZIDIC5]MDZ5453896.1 hypothetical protein [Labrys sp. ZIDIC5]